MDFDFNYDQFVLNEQAKEELSERHLQIYEEDNDPDRKQYLYGNDFKVGSRFNETDL